MWPTALFLLLWKEGNYKNCEQNDFTILVEYAVLAIYNSCC